MEPLFKQGYKVRVKKREGKETDYKFHFTPEMAELAGRVFEVKLVRGDYNSTKYKVEDDNALYELKDDAHGWNWSSGMLERVPSFEVGDKVEILEREKGNGYRYFYVDDMTKYAGKHATVIKIEEADGDVNEGEKLDDGYCYHLDVDKGNYSWCSSMLKKLEVTKRPPTYEVGQKVRIKKREKSQYGTVCYTDEMNVHRGEVHTITSVDPHDGAYDDDGYIYHLSKISWSWTASMLEPAVKHRPVDPQELSVMLQEATKELIKSQEEHHKEKAIQTWPPNAQFKYGDIVRVAPVIPSDTEGFERGMLDFADESGELIDAVPWNDRVFYKIRNFNGYWWKECLLTKEN